jgi:phosphoadenosine phosphosulfate reductase
MLKTKELFGDRDKISIAVSRIKEFENAAVGIHPAGYYVCVSGGKDSSVIQELCIMAGVKCEFVHNFTTVDCPETIYFLRQEQERLKKAGYILRFEYATDKDGNRKTMWKQIEKHGFPTRIVRWCCQDFKEYGGKGRYCMTGVRWEESARRKNRSLHETKTKDIKNKVFLNNDNDMKRKLVELCTRKMTYVLNPIIDWSEDDVWEFIKAAGVPYNPLYDHGYKRIGCIGCPFAGNRRKELDKNPKYKAAYIRAGAKYLEYRKANGIKTGDIWATPEKYFDWWVRG